MNDCGGAHPGLNLKQSLQVQLLIGFGINLTSRFRRSKCRSDQIGGVELEAGVESTTCQRRPARKVSAPNVHASLLDRDNFFMRELAHKPFGSFL